MFKKLLLATVSLFLFVSCGSTNPGGGGDPAEPSKYTVTWKNYDGTVLETDYDVEEGTMPSFDSDTPIREADAQYSYTFIGWTPSLSPVKEDIIYTATYASRVNKYTVIWQNWNGVILEVDARVDYGEWPSYIHSTPTRTSDEQYDYEFVGWSPELSEVVEDVTYTAQYQEHLRSYTVTWKNYDGSILMEEPYYYGDLPTYKGGDPVRTGDAQYSYTFVGWDKELSEVTGNTIYVAQYENNINSYTVTWKNYDGSVLSTENYNYGEVPSYKGETPTRANDEQYAYTFSGWDKPLSPVTGNISYAATFEPKAIAFTVTWKNDNGVILEVDENVPQGQVPEYNGTTPTKAADAQYTYTFIGWDKELSPVNEDVVFTALYSEKTNKYTITWKNYDDAILLSESYDYGDTPTYKGNEPTKPGSAQYGYTFVGWDKEIQTVTGDATYVARFEQFAQTYVVTFKNYDGSSLFINSFEYGTIPTYIGETPVKNGDDQYSYTFVGWDKPLAPVTEATTYTAQFSSSVNKYTVTWMNYNGDILEIDNDIEYGILPVYNGETPNRPTDEQYTYTFVGWDKEIAPVQGYTTYVAKYDHQVNSYLVTWKNFDGSVLSTETYDYGELPSYKGETPVRNGDAQYSYTFIGWSPIIKPVTGVIDYIAQFESGVNQYTVTWANYDGSVLYTESYEYGSNPTFKGATPTKPSDGQYNYSFIGWDRNIETVTSDTVYFAAYSSELCTYTVTWANYDGSVLSTEAYTYGEITSYKGDTPVRPADEQYSYSFIGWNDIMQEVTRDMTYLACYSEVINEYTVSWVNYDGTVLSTENYNYGELPSYKGETPVKEDDDQYTYYFSGWDKEMAPVTGDTTYIASYYRANHQYTIVWENYDGTIISTSENFDYGNIPVYYGPTPTKPQDGQYYYVFVGWEPEIVPATGKDTVITYRATYEAVEITYTIYFDLNGGVSESYTGSQVVTSFDQINFFYDVVKTDSSFRGWSVDEVTVIDENGNQLAPVKLHSITIFTAVYSATAYLTIISNIPEAGTVSGGGEYPYNTYVDVSTTVVQGYEFVGWYYQNNLLSSNVNYGYMMWNDDVVINAIYKLADYQLDIYTNNSDCGLVLLKDNIDYQESYSASVSYTNTITIAAYTKGDVRFLGWFDENNNLVSTNAVYIFDMPNYDYKLEAKWNYFKVQYELNGGTNDDRNINHYDCDTGFVALLNPSKDHYDFAGWSYKGQIITEIDSEWKENVVLEAVWELHEYTITYVLYNGINNPDNINHFNIESGEISLYDPSKDECLFYGWYVDSSFNVEATSIDSTIGTDVTLYAKFRDIIYVTLLVGEGEIENQTIEVSYGEAYSTPIPTIAEGYVFDYWHFNNQVIESVGSWTYSESDVCIDAYYTIAGLEYILSTDGEYYIVNKYNGTLASVTIPDEYRFIPVREISSPAFQNKPQLTSVILGKNITTIGKGAFGSNSNLESLTLPFVGLSSSAKVGTESALFGSIFTFSSYTDSYDVIQIYSSKQVTYSLPIKLKSVTILGGPIYPQAFYNCKRINSIILGDDVTSIGSAAFYCCSGLTSITLGNNITSIGTSAFDGCNYLKSISVPESCTSIGKGAFYECYSLQSMVLPFVGGSASQTTPSAETLFGYIFGDSSYLLSVSTTQRFAPSKSAVYYLPQSLTSVTITNGELLYGAFYNCSRITTIVLGDKVTSIDSYAFYGCTSLSSIEFGVNITTISDYAFCSCTSLSSIELGENITTISDYAFSSCTSLTSIVMPDSLETIGEYAFNSCTSLTSIVMPDSLETIGEYAFKNCTALTSVILPDCLVSIGTGVFNSCTKLKTINFSISSIDEFIRCDCKSSLSGFNIILVDKNGEEITEIVVPDTVIEISAYAFYNCANITSVTLSNSVQLIQDYAFYKCSKLGSITFGDSLVSIGQYAFAYCVAFDSFTIPYGVSSIANYAFYHCNNLESITLPDTILSIGQYAFAYCPKITRITLPSAASVGAYVFAGCSGLVSVVLPFSLRIAHFGVLFGKDSYDGSYSANGFYIPNSLKEVTVTSDSLAAANYNLFKGCSSLTTVIFEGDITSLPEGIFYGCTNLYTVNIPNTVVSIGINAFLNCTSLNSIEIPDSVTIIEFQAFSGCSNLSTIEIPDSVTNIGSRAFYNCSRLGFVTLPNNLSSIGYETFYNCSNLISINIPDTVTSIGQYAFYNCSSLISISIPNGVTSIPGYTFAGCSKLTSIVVPDSVTSIGSFAFTGCSGLVSITLPFVGSSATTTAYSGDSLFGYIFGNSSYEGSIQIIQYFYRNSSNYYYYFIPSTLREVTITGGILNSGAFYGCYTLTSITLGDRVTSIGSSVFYNCTALTSIDIADSVTSIGENAFASCTSLTSIIIPNSVTFIGSSAFYNCYSLESMVLPFVGRNLPPIDKTEEGTFGYIFGTNYYSGSVTTQQYSYRSDGKMVYVYYYIPSTLREVTITGGIINYNAFINCSMLTTITLGEEVTSIGNYAFSSCSNLVSFNIPNSVTSIGNYAFSSCSNLVSFNIPNSVTSIGSYAFSNCSGLTSIVVPSNVNRVYTSSFGNISDVYFVVESIENFINIVGKDKLSSNNLHLINADNEEITEIVIPNTVEIINDGAFCNCVNITSVTIGNSVTSIGYKAFYRCSNLVDVTLGNGIVSIESDAFNKCAELVSIILPDGVTSINSYTFCDCFNLISITLPQNLESIGEYAFYNCAKLASITLPRSLGTISSYAFTNCTSITSITFGNGVTTIGDYAFYNCSNLISVSLGKSITSISSRSFFNCYHLVQVINNSSLSLTKGSTDYGYVAYYAVEIITNPSESNLTTDSNGFIIYNDGINCILAGYIGDSSTVTVPDIVTSIQKYAFYNCENLTSVVVPDSVTLIGESVFAGCSNLVSLTLPFVGKNATDTTASKTTLFGYIFGESTYQSSYEVRQYYTYTLLDSATYYLPNSLTTVTITGGSLLYGAFMNCNKLTSIAIPSTITTINERLFAGCHSLTSIDIPTSVVSICEKAFSECKNLTSVVVPDSVTLIGESVFAGCSSLVSLTLPFVGTRLSATSANSTTLFGYIFGDSSYTSSYVVRQNYGSYDITYYLPNSLTTVTITGGNLLYGAFYNCSKITSITLGDNVTSIDKYVFYGCTNLDSITIGSSVTYIGYNAFDNCNNLTSIVIPSSVTYFYENALGNIKDVYFAVTSIDQFINISGKYNISNCNLHLLNADNEEITEVVIPNTITNIKDYAFYNCVNITSVTMSNSVTAIGEYAFAGCINLSEVLFSDNLNSIGGSAFTSCSSLSTVVIPGSVTVIKPFAFENCDNLNDVNIVVIYIERFMNISSKDSLCDLNVHLVDIDGNEITEVVIPDFAPSILEGFFYNCVNITSVTIPSSVTHIENNAFVNCSSLEDFYFEIDSVEQFMAIDGKEYLGPRRVHLIDATSGDEITSLIVTCSEVAAYTFYNCINIASIELNNSVVTIGDSAFQGCTGITTITIPSSVETIGELSFYDCSSIIHVYIMVDSIEQYVSRAFASRFSNGQVHLIDSTNNNEITEVVIPDSITAIGAGTFKNCSNIESVVIGENVTSIGDYAFYNCSSIESIVLPDAVTSIGQYAFSGCSSLTYLEIQNKVTSIGDYAFSNCPSLPQITYNGLKNAWNSIDKGENLFDNSAIALIYCYDGDIIINA